MSIIQNALVELNVKLEKLEDMASSYEQRVAENGNNLFGNSPVNGNGKSIDTAMLAQKLDLTIERIEQVLKEG